jgi:hypothetical protein
VCTVIALESDELTKREFASARFVDDDGGRWLIAPASKRQEKEQYSENDEEEA